MQLFTDCLPFRVAAKVPVRRGACIGILAWCALSLPAAAGEDGARPVTAALPPNGFHADTDATLPRPFDQADADRYEAIVRLQKSADWRGADALIGRLTDTRLLGHILAQRYLHPKYKTAYPEALDWLARYDDHPQAQRMHRLAMVRKPAGVTGPEAPEVTFRRVGNPDRGGEPKGMNWRLGLAYWRIGMSGKAAHQFEMVATNEDASSWAKAAGAFWAARSHLKNRQPAKASQWLKRAAEHPRTFYGQVARRALGMESGLVWAAAPDENGALEALEATSGGARALALLQVGLPDLAEDELYLLLRRNDEADLTPAVMMIAERAGLPSVSMRIAVDFEQRFGTLRDSALYPVPSWTPEGGFTVEAALLFALMRQESAFNPRAESPMGAAGLMQLMPATAVALAGEGFDLIGADKKVLFDPVFNLTLAQRYVARLLKDPNVKGDLMMLAIAYNAGPGNLAKYRAQVGHDPDPLLFIESIPGRETRQFIERVLTNYWIYQQRFGQGSPSLDALASGAWPVYSPAGRVQQATVPHGTY
jgi:soluble lytic murein transglycosylase-like protein